jgi:heme-degrading monooxygenase HmoA
VRVAIFEYKMRADADLDAYRELADRMNALVGSDERFGYVDQKEFTGSDGSKLFLEFFRDADGMRAWAENPDHREAQRRGREVFYEWYRVTVCDIAYERARP